MKAGTTPTSTRTYCCSFCNGPFYLIEKGLSQAPRRRNRTPAQMKAHVKFKKKQAHLKADAELMKEIRDWYKARGKKY